MLMAHNSAAFKTKREREKVAGIKTEANGTKEEKS
jgi:hypothetical protein